MALLILYFTNISQLFAGFFLGFSHFIMLSEETFPIELDDEQYSPGRNTDTLASTETFETSASTSAYSSESAYNVSSTRSCINASTISQNESHFASFDASNRKLSLVPPRAPVKKKKSYSCQDLLGSKKNYDHVESKVSID